ncbi:protein SMG7-like [Tripterygium wilfordii]|uniref:Protein SMG7-like n=1 Tax=Tripterygium wilfordii TaxID=458696 RepID=A0A7J7DNM5_TRIWF|nr:protein SMG7-like [Tripterygium wilfordii]XP_038702045.1 protein SMG7-like [Tripterygium wilfordii]XP_038702046.1 protein SMG7-like [Tripterygium wilfordii]XP_038702047.1 protein SMG7-like [Tripterygium wilfordii]KAF5747941.1 protein SMG7-like [Tripterygium wilfordii]
MTVPMNNSLDLSSRERVQSLFHKNVELENSCKKAAQARIPSDPNAWQQIRENYEAIILEDHVFAEQHEVEYALWQLHYRRIEELRAHLNAALASSHSPLPQDVEVSSRPERVTKIRSQFKAFLSEATGFYHDLMLKIRTKYGLPLGLFFDGPESQNVVSRDGNKSIEMKKCMISCHHCLIYLGDLSRYKGLYGEGESKTRDFAAASSYYMEAFSLCPSSGNPHHQLAILASYSGDELVAVYRYFRSLAVDNPFSTARDNLIIAFEKNRQSFSQVLESAEASSAKNALARMNRRGRGRGVATSVKDDKMGASPVKENPSSTHEILKSFSTCFIRLNGILFTRTSLEMFVEVLSVVRGDLFKLLSSGTEEKYNFGSRPSDNGLMIVRLVAILIFTVYNAIRETEYQSYAANLQCSVLRQNACTAIFEVMGIIVERCIQLQDPLTSFLLPGVLIFMEWLACQPDIAAGSEVEENQATARSFFWKSCVSLLNKLLTSGLMSINEDKDETCFSNMSTYNEGETANRLALWEDFELRGFVPLVPAQLILDFSRKQSSENDGGDREIRARLQRIVAAGKSLASVVQVGKQGMYFDSRVKRFAIGIEPQSGKESDFELSSSNEMSACDGVMKIEHIGEQKLSPEDSQLNSQLYTEMEEEDEVIVFKPYMTDKRVDFDGSKLSSAEVFGHGGGISSQEDLGSCVALVSASQDGFEVLNDLSSKAPISTVTIPQRVPSLNSFHTRSSISLAAAQDVPLLNTIDTSSRPPASLANLSQHVQPIQPSASKWLLESENSIANGFSELNLTENGLVTKPRLQKSFGCLQPATFPFPCPHAVNHSSGKVHPIQVSDTVIPSKLDSVMPLGANFNSLTSSALPASKTKYPVSRPTRHVGPPPGFVPPKFADESFFDIGLNDNLTVDDYSWLDGYELPSSTKGSGYTNSSSLSAQSYHHVPVGSSPTGVVTSFPFPGKQFPSLQAQSENHISVQDYQVLDHLKLYQEQQMQQQLLKKVNHQSGHLPEQYWGQLPREGHFFV